MQAIQCSKGHFYDKSLGQCPRCAEEARKNAGAFDRGVEAMDYIPNTAPASPAGGVGNVGRTVPAAEPSGGVGDVGRTIPMTEPAGGFGSYDSGDVGGTVGVTEVGFSTSDFSGGSAGGWQVDDYGETQASGMNGVAGFDPVVGWLVCVKGPNRGRDYRLHAGTNYIGSSKEMDVCIDNDRTISRRRAASISYDDMGKVFFIQKGEGRNLIYLNGSAVRSDADLAIYDHIIIGSTELVFVPLCCDKFTWQDM